MPEQHEYRPVKHRGKNLQVAVRHYDVRDLRGHYVKPVSAGGHKCPHKCCQGKREHPEGAKVEYDHTHHKGYTQVVAELDRRDRADRAKERNRRRSEEHRDEVYRQFWQAEQATNGYMLNKEGKRADIDPVSLFTGPERRVRKYASPELYEWMQNNGRPTRTSFLGNAQQKRRAVSHLLFAVRAERCSIRLVRGQPVCGAGWPLFRVPAPLPKQSEGTA